jgi:serine/threonine protein kinase
LVGASPQACFSDLLGQNTGLECCDGIHLHQDPCTMSQITAAPDRGLEESGGMPDLVFANPAAQDLGTVHVQVLPEVLDDRYWIVAQLGEGKFSRVSKAQDSKLGRSVAIKRPISGRLCDTTSIQGYLEEARKLAGINHPNVLQVYELVEKNDSDFYLVLQYVEGGTLGDLIREGRNFRETVPLLVPVASALSVVHSHGIIHRDIKPANILVQRPGKQPYLADFGLAIRAADYLKSPERAGTPAYMSPEQVRGEKLIDGRSDVFSLGVILYELLTGHLPFRSTGTQLLEQISIAVPIPPGAYDSSIPPELERICLKALAKNASERYATAAEFSDELRVALQNLPAASTRDSVPFIGVPESPQTKTQVPEPASDEHPGRAQLRKQAAALLEDNQLRLLILTANKLPRNLTAEELSRQIFAVIPALRDRPAPRTPMCFLFNAAEYPRKQQLEIDPSVLAGLESLATMLLPVSVEDRHPDRATRPLWASGKPHRIAADDPRIGAAIIAGNLGLRVWLKNDANLTVEDAVFASDGRDGIRERTRGGIPIDGLHASDLLTCLCEYLARIPELRSRTDKPEDVYAALDIWEGREAYVTVLLVDNLPDESLTEVQKALPPLILLPADGSITSRVNALVLQQLQEIARLNPAHRAPQS